MTETDRQAFQAAFERLTQIPLDSDEAKELAARMVGPLMTAAIVETTMKFTLAGKQEQIPSEYRSPALEAFVAAKDGEKDQGGIGFLQPKT